MSVLFPILEADDSLFGQPSTSSSDWHFVLNLKKRQNRAVRCL